MLAASPASAWDSKTHREITYLAIQALPSSPLKEFFVRNSSRLQYYSVEPDVLRANGDEAEGKRHYIDLENFGSDPFAVLSPDIFVMNKRFGAATVNRAGTLPWTIVDFSNSLEQAWARGECAETLRLAGFLSHYVGDASQPLHTTVHYDGYENDRGVHMRLERAVDDNIRELSDSARGKIEPGRIDSVWAAAIAEIRDSNARIEDVMRADRAARAQWSRDRRAYDDALLSRERALIVEQVARAASVLESIWIYEWTQAGRPGRCTGKLSSAPALP